VLGVLSLGIQWHGWEADHSPPSGAEVWNEWSYTCTLFGGLDGMYSVDFTCTCLCPKKNGTYKRRKTSMKNLPWPTAHPCYLLTFLKTVVYEKFFRKNCVGS
jgi:hypothetical protein